LAYLLQPFFARLMVFPCLKRKTVAGVEAAVLEINHHHHHSHQDFWVHLLKHAIKRN
jgi:hypothetical protein